MKRALFFILIAVTLYYSVIMISCENCRYLPVKLDFFACCDNYLNYPFSINSPGFVSISISDKSNIGYVRTLYNIITSSCKHTVENKKLSDVEVLDFIFFDKNNNLNHLTVMYDFLYGKSFVRFKNQLYEFEPSSETDNEMSKILTLACGSLSGIWRGQSTFAKEEFIESDFKNATFRFDLRWKPTNLAHDKVFISSNQDFFSISNYDSAISLAAILLNYNYYAGVAFYDYLTDTWMVEILNLALLKEETSNGIVECLFENAITIIFDKNGTIIDSYRGYTRALPFIRQIL